MIKTNQKIRKRNLASKGILEEDYYFDTLGHVIYTAKYHEKRGYCCKQHCKHCPWNHQFSH